MGVPPTGHTRPPAWRAPMDAVISFKPIAGVMRHVLHRLDVPLMRLTKGRFNLTMGLPSILLTTTGAKSGLPRSSPLLYVRHGDDIAIIGTRFGGNRHPAWYYNLKANPNATVMLDGEQYAVEARTADEDERDAVWEAADRIYSGFAKYRERITDREVPMFVLRRI